MKQNTNFGEHRDYEWMQLALEEAEKTQQMGEVPVAAIIVHSGRLISTGHNRVITDNDPSAHAEICALRRAASVMQNYRLTHCVMYVTLEPCMMCLGALIHSRIKKVCYAAKDSTKGICSKAELHHLPLLNHKLEVEGGLLAERASGLLTNFFSAKRGREHKNKK